MAKTVTSALNLGFVFSPLALSTGIEVVGNVPAVQQFDIASGEYTPNYVGIHLVLRPWISVGDPDGVLTAADEVLTNVAWYVTEGGVETAVVAGATYGIAADGTLTVKRNIDPDNPATFRCEAEFIDPRTGDIYGFMETLPVRAESVSVRPQLVVDAPKAIRYDPIRDAVSTRTVKVRLVQGDADVPAANVEFVWRKRDADGVWADIDGTDVMDYDVSLNADRSELTVDCSLIGKRIDLRCYAKYNPFGSPSSMQIDSETQMVEFAAVRYEPTLSPVILSPRELFATQKQIKPECRVSDAMGEIPNVDSYVDITWRMASGNANGTVTYGAVLATGSKPTLPTTAVVKGYGAVMQAQVALKEPLKAATHDGKILTYNGKVLLIR